MPRSPVLTFFALALLCAGCDKTASGDPGSGAAATPAAAVANADPESDAEPAESAKEEPTQVAAAEADKPASADEPEPEEPEAQPEPPPDRDILILGSSLAKTAFGKFLETNLDERDDVTCHRFAKSATGLSRPDFFDWEDAAKRELDKHKPNAVIVVMGGNDGQDLRLVGSKKRVIWGSDGWAGDYRKRVDAFVEQLGDDDREVVWLGIPRTNTTKLESKLSTIREIHKEAVEAHPRGIYISLTPFIEAEGGELMREVKVKGKFQTMRGDDGVHFTLGGSQYLSDAVAPKILEALAAAE